MREQIIQRKKIADPYIFTIVCVFSVLFWLFNQSFLVFMVTFMYIFIVLFSRFYTTYMMKHIEWSVEQIHDKLFIDEEGHTVLTIINDGKLPIENAIFRFRATDGFKWGCEEFPLKQQGNVYEVTVSLQARESRELKLWCTSRERGKFFWLEAEIIVCDPFSLITVHDVMYAPNHPTYMIYPKLVKVPIPKMNQWRHGYRKATVSPLYDETKIVGIKKYENETFRSIHWGATAKTGELTVKKYEETQADRYAVYLNLAGKSNFALRPDMNHLIEMTGGLCHQLLKEDCSFELWINSVSDMGVIHVKSRKSRKQLQQTLEVLAAITDSDMPLPANLFYKTGFWKQETGAVPLIVGYPPTDYVTRSNRWLQVYE
ncbi:DUF58 domain-containing protein [Bacillus manliponensis]|uniref:DUF58 domain-containing protein n=1 Tax=Bacillus manliponensis TaxID=574376 RepID=UPI003516943B